MSGAGRKLLSPIPGRMNYLDFVIFLISEVDKNNDVALDYWFNVLDPDRIRTLTYVDVAARPRAHVRAALAIARS